MRVFRGKQWFKDVQEKSKNIVSKIHQKDFINDGSSWFKKNKKGFIASVGALGIIVTIVWAGNHYVKANTKEVFHVYIEDQELGAVSDPEVVEKFILAKIDQFESQYPNVHMVLNTDEITYESEMAFKIESDDSVVLGKLDDELKAQAVGVELRVDGKLVGVVKDTETADTILEQIQGKYLPKKASEKVSVLSVNSHEAEQKPGQSEIEQVEFLEDINMEAVQIRPDDIVDPEEMIKKLETGDVKPTKYTVQEGDCVNCIAERFDVSPQTIYENNSWIENDKLQIGDELDLTVLQPTLSVKTVERYQELQEVHYETIYELDDSLKLGNNITVRPGKEGKKLATYKYTKVNGILTEEDLIEEEIVEKPVSAIVRKGTKVIRGEGTGSFSWPVQGAKLSSSYGMRWGRLHAGIDLTSKNKDILASDNGTVTFAGYNSGYGNYVIVDHKNGFSTLYGHMSKLNTTEGKVVEKGEKIGVMGSTGNSTGVHLHFEIRKNGSATNPTKYLNK